MRGPTESHHSKETCDDVNEYIWSVHTPGTSWRRLRQSLALGEVFSSEIPAGCGERPADLGAYILLRLSDLATASFRSNKNARALDAS